MQKLKTLTPVIATLAVAAFIVIGVNAVRLSRNDRDADENPYEYSLDGLQEVPAQLVLFKEIDPLPFEVEHAAALAVDAEGNVYVAGASSLQKYNNAGQQTLAVDLPTPATCLAVDDTGKMYIGTGQAIHVLDKQGKRLAVWDELPDGAVLTSLAVTENAVFAADAGNRLVYALTKDGGISGRINGGKAHADGKGFIIPSPYFDVIGVDSKHVWIVNPGRHLVEKYNITGEILGSWGYAGMGLDGFSGCCNPIHIVRDADGTFYTAEKGLVRVKQYTARGDFTGVVATPDRLLRGDSAPASERTVKTDCSGEAKITDLAVDQEGRVLVLDCRRKQVRIFAQK